jgi:PII-like signaling protein
MLTAGSAKKVSIYVGEDHKYHGQSLYSAILDFLFYRGISGANVVRGIAGFGADHHMHTMRIERLTENLPIKIEFIESLEKVEEVLPKLRGMVGSGLIEIQDTTVVKPSEASHKEVPQTSIPSLRREEKAKLMRIFVGENDKWRGKPLHKALVESLRAKETTLNLSHDRPMMLSVVDTEEKLRAYFPILDGMVQQGIVVLSDVDMIKYTHNYEGGERRKETRP